MQVWLFATLEGGEDPAKGANKTKPHMIIFILMTLVEQTPIHSNNVDMLKNNHVALTKLFNKAYELGPRL